MRPLVSILIPAYNAERWIAESVQSAMSQTWPDKEVIVVNDGSTDRTAEVLRGFATKNVKIVSTENRGAAAARNHALALCQGEFIQWLDADDLLAPNKIERQLVEFRQMENDRILLSGPWAHFYHRISRARFLPNQLWADLRPVEWLIRKMDEHLHMQTATWLTSRTLAKAAGPWNPRMITDDDGEYFCRVLVASDGTRFVPDAHVYYRIVSSHRVSYVGHSKIKQEALLGSIKFHINCIRSLENSERTRRACLSYLQYYVSDFYPERPDIVAELQTLAALLDGRVTIPILRRKYDWLRPVLGYSIAKWAQVALPMLKTSLAIAWDKLLYQLETGSPTPPSQ